MSFQNSPCPVMSVRRKTGSGTACSEEIDEHCRQLIVDHSAWIQETTGDFSHAPCQFGNLEDCLPAGTIKPGSSFMEKLHRVSRSQIMTKQWCYTHDRYCPLLSPAAQSDIDTSGLPCWDHSLMGKFRREEGPTNSVFMSHAKLHKERRTPILVIENVKARLLNLAWSKPVVLNRPLLSTYLLVVGAQHVVFHKYESKRCHVECKVVSCHWETTYVIHRYPPKRYDAQVWCLRKFQPSRIKMM